MDDNKGLMEATFAAGCFWHVEDAFMQIKGVVMTEVGFMGGGPPTPATSRCAPRPQGMQRWSISCSTPRS